MKPNHSLKRKSKGLRPFDFRLAQTLGHMQCKQAFIVFVQHQFKMQRVVDSEHPFASRFSINFFAQ